MGEFYAVLRCGICRGRIDGEGKISLAVATAVQCPYCIDSYTQDCLSKGVDEEQMTEAVHVAAAIKGGAALVHGVQMKNIVKKLEL